MKRFLEWFLDGKFFNFLTILLIKVGKEKVPKIGKKDFNKLVTEKNEFSRPQGFFFPLRSFSLLLPIFRISSLLFSTWGHICVPSLICCQSEILRISWIWNMDEIDVKLKYKQLVGDLKTFGSNWLKFSHKLDSQHIVVDSLWREISEFCHMHTCTKKCFRMVEN